MQSMILWFKKSASLLRQLQAARKQRHQARLQKRLGRLVSYGLS
jgi:hypothetical protein